MNNMLVLFIVSILGGLPQTLGPVATSPTATLTNAEALDTSVPPSHQNCPPDLSYLQPEMESLLSFIPDAKDFKTTLRQSLTRSLPEVIQQADGLREQVAFLQQEVTQQNQVIREAGLIAESHSPDRDKQPLTPCSPDQKGSYCSAVEQYYMTRATNLANQGFLESLLCYQRKGFR